MKECEEKKKGTGVGKRGEDAAMERRGNESMS